MMMCWWLGRESVHERRDPEEGVGVAGAVVRAGGGDRRGIWVQFRAPELCAEQCERADIERAGAAGPARGGDDQRDWVDDGAEPEGGCGDRGGARGDEDDPRQGRGGRGWSAAEGAGANAGVFDGGTEA